jgi:hypothetical protein
MRLRTIIRVGCVTVVALGLVLAGRFSTLLGVGGHPAAGGDHLSSATVSSRTDPTTHAEGAPSGAPPSGSSDAKLTATVRSNGDSGGVLIIRIPPPAPELCSPAPIKVDVGQTTVAACRSANYDGPISASVANPAIASVTTSGGLMVPRYLTVVGLQAGTTIVRVSYAHGPTTSYPITVYQTSAG